MVLNSSEMASTTDSETRWIHSDDEVKSVRGVTYNVTVRGDFVSFYLFTKLSFSPLKYLGSVEVLCSMKTLDFESRTRVARESIRLVCAAVGVALRERRKVRIVFSFPV